jgi:hypothetical protein
MAKATRVVVLSDGHSGHIAGLTHPDFDSVPSHNGSPRYHAYLARRRLWKYFAEKIEELQPIDVLIYNGDAIDGKGAKSGSTELLTADRTEQVDMAAASILFCKATEVYMSYGTSYHAGAQEDWENEVAKGAGAVKIGSHDYLDVNGLVFSYRHFISKSSIPHGRATPLARERLWNVLWSEWGEYPKADVLLRSHVHYFAYTGGFGWLGVITPALQGRGTKYGARVCSGTVDFGLIHFDVTSKEDWEWHHHVMKLRQSGQVVMKALTKKSGRRSTR